jgi:hypothetical protein
MGENRHLGKITVARTSDDDRITIVVFPEGQLLKGDPLVISLTTSHAAELVGKLMQTLLTPS